MRPVASSSLCALTGAAGSRAMIATATVIAAAAANRVRLAIRFTISMAFRSSPRCRACVADLTVGTGRLR